VELSYDRCPRCGAEYRGTRCEACARASVRPPTTPPDVPEVAPRAPLPSMSPRERWVVWGVRIAMVVFVSWVMGTCYARCGRRPDILSLRYDVDGPALAKAHGVLVFLHGYGGSIGNSEHIREELRRAGLPSDVSSVLVDGPFSSLFGRTWGETAPDEEKSVERVRALIRSTLDAESPPPTRVVVAGFSQGAGIAADVAALEPRVGALASLSGCRFRQRDALSKRRDLRILVAHGTRDSLCSVGQSRSLVKDLKAAEADVRFVEFPDDHVIPPEVIRELAAFLTPSSPSPAAPP
jgi:predicted esterase